MVATATIVPICFAALYHHCNAALYFHNLHGERYGGAVALGDESLENNADFFHCAKELASEPWPKATILARNLCVAFSLLPARMQTYVALMAMLRQLSLKFGSWLVSTFIKRALLTIHACVCIIQLNPIFPSGIKAHDEATLERGCNGHHAIGTFAPWQMAISIPVAIICNVQG